jgi:hypothetical protein
MCHVAHFTYIKTWESGGISLPYNELALLVPRELLTPENDAYPKKIAARVKRDK